MRAGKYSAAIELLESLPVAVLTPRAKNNLALSFFLTGRSSDAIPLLQRGDAEAPDASGTELLVQSLFAANRHLEIIELLKPRPPEQLSQREIDVLIASLSGLGLRDEATCVLQRISEDHLTQHQKELAAQWSFERGDRADVVRLLEPMFPFQNLHSREILVTSLLDSPCDLFSLLFCWPADMLTKSEENLIVELASTAKSDAQLAKRYDKRFTGINLTSKQRKYLTPGIYSYLKSLFQQKQYNKVVYATTQILTTVSAPTSQIIFPSRMEGDDLPDKLSIQYLTPEISYLLAASLYELGWVGYLVAVYGPHISEMTMVACQDIYVRARLWLQHYEDIIRFAEAARISVFELTPSTWTAYVKSLYETQAHAKLVILVEDPRSRGVDPTIRGLYAAALVSMRRYEDAIAQFSQLPLDALSDDERRRYAEALFEGEKFDEMAQVARSGHGPRTDAIRVHAELLVGSERVAAKYLVQVAATVPELYRPHQNIAAREDGIYSPTKVDLSAGADGLLFDQCNFLGQRVVHVGSGQLAAPLHARALILQRQLHQKLPAPSKTLVRELKRHGLDFSLLRLMGPEWTTQIGHLGMADLLMRMRSLGWWEGQSAILARHERVANQPFLDLFQNGSTILSSSKNIAESLWNELFSFQRYLGLPFNAWTLPDGRTVTWNEAGALLIRQWEATNRSSPLRDVYDRKFGASDDVANAFDAMRLRWGMASDDWHICLHMREPTFHQDSMQSHRNANFAEYAEAVRHITAQGGWVVRVGAATALPLPKMARLVDYARDPMRSPVLDLHWMRTARYFVGTISGLTNVAVSFGLPCALVNCITYDAQMWHSGVRFSPKRILSREGREFTGQELTKAPWRWRTFGLDTIKRYGITIIDSTSDEILATLKEVEHMIMTADICDEEWHWEKSLATPHYYGNGKLCRYFLQKHLQYSN